MSSRRPLPSAEPSPRVAAIVAVGSPATSPPKLPIGLAKRGVHGSTQNDPLGNTSTKAAPLDPSTYLGPGGRLRIGPDGVPLKFSLAAGKAGKNFGNTTGRGAGAMDSDPTATHIVTAVSGAFSTTQRHEPNAAVDAVLSHQLALLVSLVGKDKAAEMDVANLFSKRQQPSLVTEAAKVLLNKADDIETRHGLSFLQMDESRGLSLHLFDDILLETEKELIPEYNLDRTMLTGRRARAPLFRAGQWIWHPCTIIAVDPDPIANAFMVEFDKPEGVKDHWSWTKTLNRLDVFFEPLMPVVSQQQEQETVVATSFISNNVTDAAAEAEAVANAEAEEKKVAEDIDGTSPPTEASAVGEDAAAPVAEASPNAEDTPAEEPTVIVEEEVKASSPSPQAASNLPHPPTSQQTAVFDEEAFLEARQQMIFKFGERISKAMWKREESKAGIRLQYLVDSIKLPQDIAPLQNATLASVFSRAVAFRASWSSKEAKAILLAAKRMEAMKDIDPDDPDAAKAAAAIPDPAAEEAAELRDLAILAIREKHARNKKLKEKSEKKGFEKKTEAQKEEDEEEEEDDDDEDAINAMIKVIKSKRPAMNEATGLPMSASAEEVLAAAANDKSAASLFAEAVFEYDFAVKASIVYELTRRADEAAHATLKSTMGDTLVDAPKGFASTASMMASPELEEFTIALAASFQQLRLPPPPKRKAAPLTGKVSIDAVPGSYELARGPIKTAIHTHLAKTIHVLSKIANTGTNIFGSETFVADPRKAYSASGQATPFKGMAFPCNVKDYVRAQQASVVSLSEKLALTWLRDVSNFLVDGLPPMPYFNVYEQEVRLFEGSPVQRILRRVQAIMSQQLRDLISRSCLDVIALVERFTPDPKYDSAGDIGFTRSYKDPLFDVQLVLKKKTITIAAPTPAAAPVQVRGEEEEEKKMEGETARTAPVHVEEPKVITSLTVAITPSPAEIARALTGSLSATVSAVRMLKSIEKRVMGLLDPAPEPKVLLNLVANDPTAASSDLEIQRARDILLDALDKSLLASPAALVAKFQQYSWVAEAEVSTVVADALKAASKSYEDQVEAEEQAYALAKAQFDAKMKEEKEKRESGGAPKEDKDKPAPPPPQPPVKKQRIELVPKPLDFAVLFSLVDKFHSASVYLKNAALSHENLGLVRVRTSELRDALASKAATIREALMVAILDASKAEADGMHNMYTDMIEGVGDRPKNEAQLLAIKQLIKDGEATAVLLEEHTGEIHHRCARLGAISGFTTPENEFKLFWSLRERPAQLAWAIKESLDALDNDKARMIATLEQQKLAFEKECENLEIKVNNFKDIAYSEEDLLKIVQKANDIDSELRGGFEKANNFNERERSFGFPATQYGILRTIEESFEDFFKLWVSLAEFLGKKDSWVSTTILDLDAEGIERDVTEWWSMSYKLIKTLGDAYPGAATAAKELRRLTDDFKKNVPLIRCLASKALEWRHWHQISQRIGRKINPHEEDVTLTELLAGGILAKFEEVEEVAVMAEKEHNLKKTLDAMTKEWDSISFDVVAYKESGTFVVRGTDEINQMLDDQIVKTQTMMGSPYIKPNIEQCTKWERLLVTVQLVLEEWLMMQRTWMYLEPIFSSEDIMRQMPQEGRRFATVDKLFRKTMGETHDEPKALVAAGKDKMLDKTREANKLLDQIQKGLNDYLELKRLAFPRFFFLSNDELLEILSQTKDPRAAQPHLGKCFEGLAKIAFRGDSTGNPDDVLITHMISAEGESIPLMATVDPNSPKAKGNVEVWFLELQRIMRLTVKDVVQKSLVAYPQTGRGKWCCTWPGQVVLNVSQLYWTREVEDSLDREQNQGLINYLKQLNGQLQEIVNLVRGKLSKMERTTLGALTVIDVHARDVIQEMGEAGVDKATDFNWSSQLRYYWEEKPDTGYDRYGDNPMNLVAKIINAAQCYGYEYLGNSSRLVITPLTDRCYRTLVSAVYLGYGGAPAGPAGTGKTETTKDLAKAMAIQCVVFNCSDGLDYMAMAKMFKGLAAAGAWACFDEFNRIELEVLSVVAQQVLTIQKAKRAKVQKFNFEGTILPLNPDANAFITMNPGYAGRSELPDNLKVLFRPVAMMVPDYALISEIKLYSFGFGEARLMARKLTQVLRLSSEQLSSQKHYDYGMRAVFSILVRAGALRQVLGNDPKWSEDKIVLSAVQDVNIPKFTSTDLPLFKGIISDLFTGVVLPKPDYRVLNRALLGTCRITNLQPKDEFIKSVVQLFETVQVRHGLMLVGETGCGKTSVLRTLQIAMSSIQGNSDFCKVHVHSMNPKSITQGQLYGNFDDNTHEWTDGVLAVTYRNASRDTNPERHWIMFDGPVDAVWIENMNTVLDDNKKLCLNSGEIIKMSPYMTMMFETDSLAEASPATVSRVGMVYMEPRRLGWRPVVQSWVVTLPRAIAGNPQLVDLIFSLFEWLLPPLLAFVANFAKQLTPVTDLMLAGNIVRMFDSLLEKPFGRRKKTEGIDYFGVSPTEKQDDKEEKEEFSKNTDAPKPPDFAKVIEGFFYMSCIWTIGGVVDNKGRAAFSEYFKQLTTGKGAEATPYKDFKLKAPLYDGLFVSPLAGAAARAGEGDVRDRDYDEFLPPKPEEEKKEGDECEEKKEEEESKEESKPAPPSEESLSRFKVTPLPSGDFRVAQVPVPDDETVFDYVFKLEGGKAAWKSWASGMPAYKVPEGATYQSIIVPTVDSARSAWLLDLFITHGQHVLCVGETGTGKSVTLLQKLMSGLDRDVYLPFFLNFSAQTSANQTQEIIDGKMGRRRKGVFGPPLGQKFVILVEDLNMPAKEKYGAQPPIEILRQWMDHGGWYDRNDKDQAFMELTDIQFLAAMGPPGGGRTRISERYVRHFNVLGFVPFSNESLQRMFGTIMQWATGNFAAAVKQTAASIVTATIDVYNSISRDMLPTPAKSHYTFNLRDLSKVFQGMNGASEKKITEGNQYYRLWAHECMRIFFDRLTTDQDRKWFINLLADRSKEVFKKDWIKDVRGPHENLIYGNFVDQKTNAYEELANRQLLDQAMATALDDFNATSKSPLKLVLFGYAVEHVARISRILNQPGGNALLVGVGGSGRKSLTTLATFMAGFKLFQVEITKAYGMNEWRDDLKKVLMQAGREGKATVFLFSDTQIVKESFVEDINNVLNNGEVPNLFAPDERAGIIGDVQVAAKKEGKMLSNNTESYAYFIDRVKAKLHVVLCFSPIGDAFRTRLRMFPSLVNCTTIDWFTPWPEEGLRSVATHFLDGVSLPGHSEVKEGVIDVCCDMQQRVTALSTRFLIELRRYYYVTPTSYLELINTFKSLIGKKKTEILTAKSRYENGLEKIVSTENMVDGMKKDLIELQPKLVVASAETDAMIANIEIVSKEANAKAVIVAGEEAICNEQAAAANAIKSDCETQLAEAIPILEAALKAVGNLSKNDITEVKALKKPPDGVRLTVEALCIMFAVAPKKVPNPAGKGPKVDDYWEVGVKEILGNSKLLEDLKGYDSDNIPVEIINKIAPYIVRPDFAEDVIARGSVAAGGLCKWVHAVYKYDKVAKIVAPKKAALAQATNELNAAMTMLAGKQAELKELKDKLAALEADLAGAIKKKNDLMNEVETCKNRLDRANKLVSGLGGEKVRWTASAANLQVLYDNIVGDVLLSAGMIAYLGAFTSNFRDECITEWSKILTGKKIPCAASFKLNACLGDQVAIRNWVINKLPNDSFSIDNAIMMSNSGRWPLCIDPQRQANKWIRNFEGSRGIKVVKQSQNTFVRTIESAIQFGQPVLLENVPEALDPVLEPLLARQLVKVGGVMTIRIGDSTVEYDHNFKLYITTVLPNPHYPPETCVKVNLLNFMATAEGLQDQMLGIVVKTERPELEEQREKLVLEDAENKRMLKELEDKILYLLASSTGNILDDDLLITTLADSKVTSNQIMKAVEIAERTVAKIATARLGYVPVARRASMLFFCIADLASVDPMYQYSLEFYIRLFLLAIDKAPKPEEPASKTSAAVAAMLEKRITALKDTFTAVLYEQVCRSLFEKDKLLFSFLLAAKVMTGDGKLDQAEARFFLQGSISMALRKPNPVTAVGGTWLTDKQWADFLDLAKQAAPVFKDLDSRFEKNLSGWEKAAASPDPLPEVVALVNSSSSDGSQVTSFQALMALRCLRPDKVIPALQQFIAQELGAQFIDPPTFNLQKCFDDSDACSPLIFVLVSGADPMSDLLKLGDKVGKAKTILTVSLGQGQGPIAERAIADAIETGKWVCLQNCHLAESWLPTLERLVEEIRPDGTHPEFRLWLTAMPNPKFPVAVLQNGVKMTYEPPKGMRANLQGSFVSFDQDWFEGSIRSDNFRRLVFGVCFFHAQCLERKKFGALGWNIRYDFSESDLRISLDQLKIFIDDPAYPENSPPFAALTYLTGDCNYGGRVTDDNDRRSLIAILSDIYKLDCITIERHKLSPSGTYYIPPATGSLAEYLEYIRSLPFSEGPEVFGLNENSNISTAINETNGLLGTALALQPRATGGASSASGEKVKSPDEILADLCADISKKVPDPYDIEYVEVKYPVAFEESLNTVLTQECMRYNHLVGVVKRSLREVGLAIRGLSVMSADLEAVGNAMAQGKTPAMWTSIAYACVKPLGGWINDLVDRLVFLQTWIDKGKPPSFWISGFFFTQSFMTGVRQNYARKHSIPIDELAFKFRVLTPSENDAFKAAGDHATPPADGTYVFGLYFQAAAWDGKNGVIGEAAPRELFSPLPLLHLLPCRSEHVDKGSNIYLCPTYKTSERAGLLSTSGHSSNYIIQVALPMSPQHNSSYWLKRSACLLTTLDT